MVLESAAVPMRVVGPIKLVLDGIQQEQSVPLATYETPLWPSVSRGARVSRLVESGIQISVKSNCMTRSVAFSAKSSKILHQIDKSLPNYFDDMQSVVKTTSSFAKLQKFHTEIIGNQYFVRFSFDTKDAAGHNMATKASDALMKWFIDKFSDMGLKYVSISANICTDKKVSAVNSILGRGVHVTAEILIPKDICNKYLKTTPEKIVDLHIRKNLMGSIAAGSLRSANAHVANMLLAFYLATGQDAANIIEGSQAMDHAEVQGEDLYFSVTLPNIILGTIGAGKNLDFVQQNLNMLGCVGLKEQGEARVRLASICAATALCGELSLLAAQTNPGELVSSHMRLERVE